MYGFIPIPMVERRSPLPPPAWRGDMLTDLAELAASLADDDDGDPWGDGIDWGDDEPLTCGVENPETCEACN